MTTHNIESTTDPRARGHCLCGAVQYEVHGPLRPVVACHCEMCRRTSGHYVAATACEAQHLRLTEDRGLRWYQSSAAARRGFCQECGSNLFWHPQKELHIAIMAGSLDQPTGLSLVAHIYASAAGDYYQICDTLARHDDGAHGIKPPYA
ncbi:MAG: GFA family protein [Gammaproteobacteria bacterium]|nr:GFA family protein [Gammaproteobacteria bacterium]